MARHKETQRRSVVFRDQQYPGDWLHFERGIDLPSGRVPSLFLSMHEARGPFADRMTVTVSPEQAAELGRLLLAYAEEAGVKAPPAQWYDGMPYEDDE